MCSGYGFLKIPCARAVLLTHARGAVPGRPLTPWVRSQLDHAISPDLTTIAQNLGAPPAHCLSPVRSTKVNPMASQISEREW